MLKPEFVIIENVPNMLLMKKGLFRSRIQKALSAVGYSNLSVQIVDASEFGVPQARRRAIFLATRPDVLNIEIEHVFTAALRQLKNPGPSVIEAIGDLPSLQAPDSDTPLLYPKGKSLTQFQREMRLDADGKAYTKDEKQRRFDLHSQKVLLFNHHTKEIQERRLNLIKLLAPGKKADSLPKHVWDNARPEKWRRFHPDQVAYTLMAQMHRDLSEWVHPTLDRWITVREAMRLQSFHDGFVLRTSEWQQLKQVGNAVPPLLGRALGEVIRVAMNLKDGKPIKLAPGTQMNLFSQL